MVDDGLESLGITEDDVFRECAEEIDAGLNAVADAVKDAWIEMAPEDTGEYKKDIQVSSLKDENDRPARRVGDYAKYAHIVEYGSNDTPERGVRAKVSQRFGNEGKYMV